MIKNPKNPACSKHPRKHTLSVKPEKIILITLLILTPFLSLIKPASSATIYVPAQYSTVQDAVDHAIAGDTIQVAAGTYYEHVSINKTLTIIGQNPQTTIVDGTNNGTVFYIEDAKNVRITGFTIRNAGNNYSAVVSEREIKGSDNNRIENNIITNGQYGVYCGQSDNNKIYNNTIVNNSLGGIYLSNSDTTNVTGNTITDSAYGVRISSISNQIVNNTITQTSYGVYIIAGDTGNTIRRNTITGRTVGVYSAADTTTVDHNKIAESAYGVYLYNSKNSPVSYNTIATCSYGIRLYWSAITSSTHTVTNNKITNSDWALELVNSNGNTFWGNLLQQNTYGIYMTSSSSNQIYRNNFVQNSMQAYAGTGTNTWDKLGNGNHWSDHTNPDANGNGIVDTAYNITPIGKDNYPLKYTWSEHDVAVTNVSPSANQANPGQVVTITVQVRNNANISTTATFQVTAKYNNTAIGTQQVTNLAQGATSNLVFNWDTTGVAPGNYTIKAEATVVTDELYTDNNIRTDGIVEIKAPLAGDINGDGTINQLDLLLLEQEYGLTPDSPTWNPSADLNHDNIINEQDLYILGQNYGQTN